MQAVVHFALGCDNLFIRSEELLKERDTEGPPKQIAMMIGEG